MMAITHVAFVKISFADTVRTKFLFVRQYQLRRYAGNHMHVVRVYHTTFVCTLNTKGAFVAIC
jgi:hypothetical protein